MIKYPRQRTVFGQSENCCDMVILVARASRSAAHQQGQGKADATSDQHRTERVFLHLPRDGLRAVTEGVAAVLISVLRVVDGGVGSVARCVLGLAVEILRRAGSLAGPARCLTGCIIYDTAGGAFDLTGEILRRACNSILVHGAPILKRIHQG